MRRLAVIICSLLIALAAHAQDAAPLLAWVRAGASSGVYNYLVAEDSSGSGNHGACSDTNILKSVGDGNWYARFVESSDVITVTNSPSLELYAAYSISCWVLIDARVNTHYIVSRGIYGNADHFGIYVSGDYVTNPGLSFNVRNGFKYSYVNVVTGAWYHAVGTFDGTTAKIYVNGVFKDSFTPTAPIQGAQSIVLGRRTDGSFPTVGNVANVAIYDTDITTQNVAALYSAGRHAAKDTISTANLVGFWSMKPEEE